MIEHESSHQSKAKTALSQYQRNCELCYFQNPSDACICECCGKKLSQRKKSSLQHTIALLITSIILYIPANLLPIMYTNYLGEITESTIVGGVVTLWGQGSYPVALIIFVASVLVPIGKILALIWLCYFVKQTKKRSSEKNQQLYRVTEFIGRWSMVDVFVVAILVALIQMGNLMSVHPGEAAIAFAGLVITTMLAANTFDSKLIWQSKD